MRAEKQQTTSNITTAPAANLEVFRDNQTFVRLTWVIGHKTRRYALYALLFFAFCVGPFFISTQNPMAVFMFHYWVHDIFFLPLKGRLWLEPWPGSLIAFVFVFVLIMAGLFARRFWAQIHLGVALEMYRLPAFISVVRLWTKALRGRLPLKFSLSIYDLLADQYLALDPKSPSRLSKDILALPVELRLIRLSMSQHGYLMPTTVRLLELHSVLTRAQGQALTSQLAEYLSSTSKSKLRPLEAHDRALATDAIRFLREIAFSAASEKDKIKAAQKQTTELHKTIKDAHASISKKDNPLCKWSDGGILARTIALKLSPWSNNDILSDWFLLESRADFASVSQSGGVALRDGWKLSDVTSANAPLPIQGYGFFPSVGAPRKNVRTFIPKQD